MSAPSLNFHRAMYEGDPVAPDQCAYCGRGITDAYYRVGGNIACPTCAQQAQSLTPPNAHSAFLHALSYGAAAAVLGCIGYALVVILTGWTIGYAAIGVGYLIGWAMRKAAKEHGGRRYQWAAALLTYAAVSMAFVPIAMHQMSKHKAEQARVTTNGSLIPGTKAYPQNYASQEHPFPNQSEPAPAKKRMNPVAAIGLLLGLGLVSPFLGLTGSFGGALLNLFIIFIGVRFAWQMMAVRTVSVEGPFEAKAPPQSRNEDGAAAAS